MLLGLPPFQAYNNFKPKIKCINLLCGLQTLHTYTKCLKKFQFSRRVLILVIRSCDRLRPHNTFFQVGRVCSTYLKAHVLNTKHELLGPKRRSLLPEIWFDSMPVDVGFFSQKIPNLNPLIFSSKHACFGLRTWYPPALENI